MFTNSAYCFKKLLKVQSWTKARIECERDEGDLATFGNTNEMLHFSSSQYFDFRFGYRKPWKQNGKNFPIVFITKSIPIKNI